MKNKEKKKFKGKFAMRIFDLIFIIVIISTMVATISSDGDISITFVEEEEFAEYTFKEIIEHLTAKQIMQTFIGFLFIFMFMFLIAAIKNFWLTSIYIGVKIAYGRYKKSKLDEIDTKNDTYYRELIPELSAASLGYIDSFELHEKDVVATILALELKKKIKIESNITVIDTNDMDLSNNEKYIFNLIKENKLKEVNMFEFKNIVIKDCLEKGLLENEMEFKRNRKKKIIVYVATFILINILFTVLPTITNSLENEILNMLGAVLMFALLFLDVFYPFIIIATIHSYMIMKGIDPYVRTKEGKELNKKLEGLKKYIADFSKLDQRKKDDLMLWEDYLVYSVIFGINTDIVTDIMNIC